MNPEENAKRERDMDAVRREMQRKSLDTIRIYNPLEQDFMFKWDGYPNVIKAKSTKDVERYKAAHYFKKISNFMIGELGRAKGEELLADRRKRGVPEFLDKYAENKEVWDKTPRLDDPELLKEIGEVVIVGLVEEYGLELPSQAPSADFPTGDLRPIHEQISDALTSRLASDGPAAPEKAPVKEKLVMEVTQE